MRGLAPSLLLSLLLTLALELPYALLLRKRGRDLLLVALVNILTNPAVVLCYTLLTQYALFDRLWVTILLEAIAIAVEALYYWRYGEGFRHPLLFSLSANAFSYCMGKALQSLLF